LSTAEDIDLLLPVEAGVCALHEGQDCLGRTVHSRYSHILDTTFDSKNNLVGVLGKDVEIAVHEVERVVVGCAVDIGSVPDIDARGENSLENFESFLIGRNIVFPGQTYAIVSFRTLLPGNGCE
jgi:hypothetical protein